MACSWQTVRSRCKTDVSWPTETKADTMQARGEWYGRLKKYALTSMPMLLENELLRNGFGIKIGPLSRLVNFHIPSDLSGQNLAAKWQRWHQTRAGWHTWSIHDCFFWGKNGFYSPSPYIRFQLLGIVFTVLALWRVAICGSFNNVKRFNWILFGSNHLVKSTYLLHNWLQRHL